MISVGSRANEFRNQNQPRGDKEHRALMVGRSLFLA